MIRRPSLSGEPRRDPKRADCQRTTPCDAGRPIRSGPIGSGTFSNGWRWIRSHVAGAIKSCRCRRARRGAFHQGQVPIITTSTEPLRDDQRLLLWRIRDWYDQNPTKPRTPLWRRLLGLSTAFVVNAAGLALVMAFPFAIALAIASVSPPQEPT